MCRALCPLAYVTQNNRRNWYLLNYKFPDDSIVDKFETEKLFGFFSIPDMEKIKVEQETGSNL